MQQIYEHLHSMSINIIEYLKQKKDLSSTDNGLLSVLKENFNIIYNSNGSITETNRETIQVEAMIVQTENEIHRITYKEMTRVVPVWAVLQIAKSTLVIDKLIFDKVFTD